MIIFSLFVSLVGIYQLCALKSIPLKIFLCITIHRSENGIAKIVLDFLKRSTFLIVGAVAVLK